MAKELSYCQWPHCTAISDYWLRGQWTIFDWWDMEVCLVHVPQAIGWLQRRRVDGQEVVEIQQHALGQSIIADWLHDTQPYA
jgi:hypothetical protein